MRRIEAADQRFLTRRSHKVVFRSAKERSFAERKTTFPHAADIFNGKNPSTIGTSPAGRCCHKVRPVRKSIRPAATSSPPAKGKT